MKIEYVRPQDLKAADYNPRKISRKSLRALADLLDAHGFVDPLIARREDGLLIGGHQRLKANALRKNPDPLVPVVFLDGINDERAKALNIALNNPAAQGRYDVGMVGELLAQISQAALDAPTLTGFDRQEAEELMAGLNDMPVLAPTGDLGDAADVPESVVVILEMTPETFSRAREELDRIIAEHELSCHVRMGDLR
jgi:ParB-like chromosome segregation protein Spo0J